MAKFEKLLNQVSIKKSLKIIFLVIFILPVVILSIFFIAYLYNVMLNWEKEKVLSSLSQTEDVFNSALVEIQDFSDRIYVNKPIQSLLETQYDNIQQVYQDYANLSFLENYLLMYNQVSNYKIYTENQTLLDNSFIKKTDSKIEAADWYRKAITLHGKYYWLYKEDDVNKKNYLCLIRSLWVPSTDKFIGVLVINLDPDYINQKLLTSTFNTGIFIENQLIFYAFEDFSADSLRQFLASKDFIEFNENNIAKIRLEKNRYGIMAHQMSAPANSSLKFLTMYIIPMKQLIKATTLITVLSISLLLLLLLLSTVVIMIFINYLDGRVSKVQTGISNVVEKNFEIAPSIGGNDEFEKIYKELYEMSCDIKNLIETVYKQNLEKEQFSARQNEMSFKMLSNQINPHFLFNTLETIRMKSLASGQKDVATMLKLLASLLRYNLSVKGQPVPLMQELDAVQNYLNIQHMRFEDRITYDIVTMCDIGDVLILPLLIQPLVENSFSHGLENRVSGGFIYILINTEIVNNQKIMTISVKDNGCGIDENKLAELNEQLENGKNEDSSTHIGIANVNSRIKLYYGNDYGIFIESDFGEGTIVTIKIPV